MNLMGKDNYPAEVPDDLIYPEFREDEMHHCDYSFIFLERGICQYPRNQVVSVGEPKVSVDQFFNYWAEDVSGFLDASIY